VLNIIRAIFNLLSKSDRFLRENQLWNFNGFTIIFVGILIVGVVTSKIAELFNWAFMNEPFVFLYGSFIYSIIPYLFFKSVKLKKYLLFGEEIPIEELAKQFNTRAYFVFVVFFSYFLFFPLIGIPLMFNIFDISILKDFVWNNMGIIVLVLLTVTSILWFAYHLIAMNVRLQTIKTRVALYIAIGTTITLLNLKTFENFTTAVSCLLVSYFWIQYLIEIRTEEIEERNNSIVTQEE